LGSEGDRAFVWAVAHAAAHELPDRAAAPVLERAAAGVDSWSVVMDLLRVHRCETLAYRILTMPAVRAACEPPESIVRGLRNWYRQTFERIAFEPRVVAGLLSELATAGVPALAIKGLVVGAWLYDDPVLREHDDIDLLVPEALAASAHSILTDIGYEAGYRPPLFPLESPGGADYRHPGRELHVDLSFDPWLLFWRNEAAHRDLFDTWWARRQDIEIGGYRLPTLGPEDQFIQLARHLQFHDYFRANMWVDLGRLLHRHGDRLDWDIVGRDARAFGIHGGLYRTLELLARGLAVTVPDAAADAMRPSWPVRRLHRSIWEDDLAGIRERPPIAGRPIIPRFLSPGGPHVVAGVVLHTLSPSRGRTLQYLVRRYVPPQDWLRSVYMDTGRRSYPALLRHHWQQLAELRRRVRNR
jgi:hypothetical protein